MTEASSNSPSRAVDDLRIVDLFAGPGGLDVAAHWLGIPSIGVEFDPDAILTRDEARLTTLPADVRDLVPSQFEHANVLMGGPPCQTFTVAGTGHGRRALDTVLKLVEMLRHGDVGGVEDEVATMTDIRTGLVLTPLIWAILTEATGRPYDTIVLEQVPAVLPVWQAMGEVLRGLGYGVDVGVLSTEEFGVPQTRRRAILIARHGVGDEDVRLPSPTHRRFDRRVRDDRDQTAFPLAEALPRWVSMSDALGESRPFRVRSNYGQGGDPRKRGIRYHDEPAFTVTGKVSRNRMIFPDETFRLLTAEQAGRLQTFPHNFPWRGRDMAQQIGNAVPPRLGAHVLTAALGLDPGLLTEEFFAERMADWVAPTDRQRKRAASIHSAPVTA